LTEHILPVGSREGIVLNLPEHRLYYYLKPSAARLPSAPARRPIRYGNKQYDSQYPNMTVLGAEKDPEPN
jgi:L,D-transpeptidase ErfK/SrfK